MRRAAWQPLPKDPPTPLAWWWRGARPLICALSLASATLLAIGIFLPTLLTVASAWFFGGTIYFATAFVLVKRWRQGPWAVAELPPSPAPAEAFPVEYALSIDGVCTGRDQGVASFVEGWLHVEGLRTTFSLRPLDTTRVGISRKGEGQFDLPGGQRIELRPLATSASDRATFSETVRVWHRFTVAPPPGEPLLPPLEIHPSAVARPFTALVLSVLGIAAFLACVVATLILNTSWAGWLVPLGTVGMVAAGNGSKAMKDLRRLKALDRAALLSRETKAIATSERR